jgi:hypothetical protein
MKQLLILIFVIAILSSCVDYERKNTQSESEKQTELKIAEIGKKNDTIFNYWELILDTISDQKEFKNLNKNYKLKLKTFSLNDSLIIRNLGQGESQAYLDHSHTMVTDLELFTDSIVDRKRIDRTFFKKSLITEFYQECNLFSTEIDSINGNTIYLTSDLNVPDTDNQWRVWYSIKINNNKLEKLEVKKTDYVGL